MDEFDAALERINSVTHIVSEVMTPALEKAGNQDNKFTMYEQAFGINNAVRNLHQYGGIVGCQISPYLYDTEDMTEDQLTKSQNVLQGIENMEAAVSKFTYNFSVFLAKHVSNADKTL